jgi:hypothetical protein
MDWIRDRFNNEKMRSDNAARGHEMGNRETVLPENTFVDSNASRHNVQHKSEGTCPSSVSRERTGFPPELGIAGRNLNGFPSRRIRRGIGEKVYDSPGKTPFSR